MADERKYYVICEQNCKFEGMTKEQILTAITQAVNEGRIGNIDTGFIQTVKTINGKPLRFFVGEQSEYESLSENDKKNLFALITNDTTKEALLEALENLQYDLQDMWNGLVGGSFVVAEAKHAENATNATNATNADKALSASRATAAEVATSAYCAETVKLSSIDLDFDISDMVEDLSLEDGVYMVVLRRREMAYSQYTDYSCFPIFVCSYRATCSPIVKFREDLCRVRYEPSKKILHIDKVVIETDGMHKTERYSSEGTDGTIYTIVKYYG